MSDIPAPLRERVVLRAGHRCEYRGFSQAGQEAGRRHSEGGRGRPPVPHPVGGRGSVVCAEQSRGIEPLRAFAKWLDCEAQFPEFTQPPDNDYCQHTVMHLELHQVPCPHLVWHDCFNGYYLPCEFEELVHVGPHTIFGHWPAMRPVGSSVRLLRELDLVQERLQVSSTYDYSVDDALLAVKAAYLQMREAAELSCRHGLPIIFWG